jgi:hypothetical protein
MRIHDVVRDRGFVGGELPLRGILPVCVYGGLLQFTLQQINGAACRTSF